MVVLLMRRALSESMIPGAGANHQIVVMPTGKVIVACIPLNKIVVVTGTGFQVVEALSYQFRTTSE